MDKFQIAEMDGRILFKSILDQCKITNYQESLEQYDTLDMYYTNFKDQYVGVEIKKRSEIYEVYDDYIMELSKFKAICQRLIDKEIDKAIYANFFGDNVAYLFNIKNIIKAYKEGQIKIQYYYCNITTAEDNGKRYKPVLLLPKKLATRLEKDGDKWIIKN